ncbi:MAG: TIGR02281 family clan AA aspartic protease [Gemmobacter sp.]|nr:TIGR02281 family clan AA aspartic protease [Gemmobacter sp.]
MDDNLPRIIYLVILSAAVGAWVMVEYRGRMGQMMRAAAAWGLIFIGVAAGYGLWADLRTELAPRQTVIAEEGRIELPRAQDGHYYLTLTIQDTPVRFMIDTGASTVVLSDRDSERLGIDRTKLAFTGSARTANGTIRTARITLDNVALDGIPEGRLPAWVGDGPLDVSLLGMDYLSRFARVEIARDRLILHR